MIVSQPLVRPPFTVCRVVLQWRKQGLENAAIVENQRRLCLGGTCVGGTYRCDFYTICPSPMVQPGSHVSGMSRASTLEPICCL